MNGTEAGSGDAGSVIGELQGYFSDQVAPLLVTDAMETVLRHSPELAGTAIESWARIQVGASGRALALADYFYHAVKKLHIIGEFGLVPAGELKSYLEQLSAHLVGICPEADRQRLRDGLENLGKVEPGSAAAIDLVLRPASSAGTDALAAGCTPRERSGAGASPRFQLLLAGMARGRQITSIPAVAGEPSKRDAVLTELVTTAALGSHTSDELDRFLVQLSQRGTTVGPGEMFRALGDGIPEWVVPARPQRAGQEWKIPHSAAVEAMHRIVAVSKDTSQAADRFGELAKAAVERFNDGSLVSAAQMFEVAERLAREKRVDADVADRLRRSLHESLDERRLLEYAQNSDNHSNLRAALGFFPELSVRALLTAAETEPDRQRRMLRLLLLEAHGQAARAEVTAMLRERGDQAHHFLQRNLVHLLRKIPPSEDEIETDLGFLESMSGANRHPMVVREAIAALAALDPGRTAPLLTKRLREFERISPKEREGGWDTITASSVLDRIAPALARSADRSATRALVDHGLDAEAKQGTRVARLSGLGARDLSSERDCLRRLREALKHALPLRMLGVVLRKENDDAIHLVQALSGTRDPDVLADLNAVVERYPGTRFAAEAKRALSWDGASQQESPFTSGDLPTYGLSTLLERLAQERATGRLTLHDGGGDVRGLLALDEGNLTGCRAGELRGEAAFYQLFERPAAGTYSFEARDHDPRSGATTRQSVDLYPLILEAVNRCGELSRFRAIVPEDQPLRAAAPQPTTPPGESDGKLVRGLWEAIQKGANAAQCETIAGVDSFRVRRILAHWIESGTIHIP